MRRLMDTQATKRYPMGRPVDHLGRGDRWITEQLMSLRCVVEQCAGQFLRLENRFDPKSPAELFGNVAHAESFWPRDVQDQRRRLAMNQRAQAHGVGISLPDDIHEWHAQVHCASFKNGSSDIEEHSITKINCIV